MIAEFCLEKCKESVQLKSNVHSDYKCSKGRQMLRQDALYAFAKCLSFKYCKFFSLLFIKPFLM